MRILHLLSQTELTGAEVYAQTLIQSQLTEGHSVFLASDSWHLKEIVPCLKIPISKINHWSWNQKDSLKKLVTYITTHKIDIIHSHSRAAARAANRIAKYISIARVTTLHGRQHSSISKRLFNIYGDYQIAVCENVRLSQIQRFKTDPDRIKVIRNPFNIPADLTLSRGHVPPNSYSAKLKIAWIGRSSGPKGKNLENLLTSQFEKWEKSGKDFVFTVVATNKKNFSDHFQTWLKTKENNMSLVFNEGHVSPLNDFILSQDLVIGSGRVAVESLLLSKPNIAMGEYSYEGIVNSENLEKCLQTNFGDIGIDAMIGSFDWDKIGTEILNLISNPEKLRTPSNLLPRLKKEFSLESVSQKIIQTYECALLTHHCQGWLPILMYHKIPTADINSKHKIYVSLKNFEKHLLFFKKQKFTYLTFGDLIDFFNGEKNWQDFPKKPLMLTFDDGYLDNLKNAQPLLEKYRAKAIIYLLANHDITENTWDLHDASEPAAPLMNLSEKKQLSNKVFEIGSHGFSHLDLTKLNPIEIEKDLTDSRKKLSEDLGREVISLAYPYGLQNQITEQLAAKAGYLFAVNTDKGAMNIAENRFSIFRVNIFPDETWISLWKKTRPWYRSYFFKKRGQ